MLNQHVKALLAGAFYQTIAAGEGGFGVVELTIAHGFADELGIRNLQIAFYQRKSPAWLAFDHRIAELVTGLWSVFLMLLVFIENPAKGSRALP